MRPPRIGITTSNHGDAEPLEGVGREYVDAVVAAGGAPLILPVLAEEDAPALLAAIDGLLLTGGGDVDPLAYGRAAHAEVYGVNADRDRWELALAREAAVPVLGICRGTQVLNVAAGGTLVQHLPDRTTVEHRLRDRPGEVVHHVDVVPGSRLHAVVGSLEVGVNSLHHQAVSQVGSGLVVAAVADDGTIEAIEGTHRIVLGVQWHPELMTRLPVHASVFSWLVAAASAHRAHGSLPELASSSGHPHLGSGQLS